MSNENQTYENFTLRLLHVVWTSLTQHFLAHLTIWFVWAPLLSWLRRCCKSGQ